MSKTFVSAFDSLGPSSVVREKGKKKKNGVKQHWEGGVGGGAIFSLSSPMFFTSVDFFFRFSPYTQCGARFQAREFDAKPYTVEPR